MLTIFPRCNFSLEFPEILSQNRICYHWVCPGFPKPCIVGYLLTSPNWLRLTAPIKLCTWAIMNHFSPPFCLFLGQPWTTVGEEKQHNPRLSKSKTEFVEIMKNLNLPYPKQIGMYTYCIKLYLIFTEFWLVVLNGTLTCIPMWLIAIAWLIQLWFSQPHLMMALCVIA